MIGKLQVVSLICYILLPSVTKAEVSLSGNSSQPTNFSHITYATMASDVIIETNVSTPINIRNVSKTLNVADQSKLMTTKIISYTNINLFTNASTLTSNTSLSIYKHGLRANWWDDIQNIEYDVICKLQPNTFDCSTWKNKTYIPRYYYDIKMQTCLTFKYYECGLSLNNFISLFECNEHCRAPGPQPIAVSSVNIYCRLQPDFGDCHHYHPMYYFDITLRTCIGFAYGGCGGNRNRFDNAQKCVAVCSPVVGAMD